MGGKWTSKTLDLVGAGVVVAALLWGWTNWDTKVRPAVNSVLDKVSSGVQSGPGKASSPTGPVIGVDLDARTATVTIAA
jgi:hypothetical protein